MNKLAQRSTLTKVDEHVDIASASIALAAVGMTADILATRILLRDSQLCQRVVSGYCSWLASSEMLPGFMVSSLPEL